MNIVDLGLIRHADALAIQLEHVDKVAAGAENTVFLLEHPPTITLGRHGGRASLLVSEEAMQRDGIELVETTRGGDVTCHYPGQLVAYPIFRVAARPGGMRSLFYDLEEVVIRTLAHFSLHAQRSEGRPGVWIAGRKIASIGLGVRRWISYHGLSLNVGNDLDLFQRITLCGLHGVEPTSLHRELGDDFLSMQEIKDVCAQEFRNVFAHSSLA